MLSFVFFQLKQIFNLFFFSFSVPENATEVDPQLQVALSLDYELGDILRQTVVQEAVLYFTGEALLSDDEDDEDEEFDEEGASEEDY